MRSYLMVAREDGLAVRALEFLLLLGLRLVLGVREAVLADEDVERFLVRAGIVVLALGVARRFPPAPATTARRFTPRRRLRAVAFADDVQDGITVGEMVPVVHEQRRRDRVAVLLARAPCTDQCRLKKSRATRRTAPRSAVVAEMKIFKTSPMRRSCHAGDAGGSNQ